MTALPDHSPIDPPPAVRRRQGRQRRCTALAVAIAAGLAGPASATLVSFDTTTLAGASARLDFSLLDGDGVLGNNTFTVASITTDGTLGGFDCSLGCSGGPPFTITEASELGQLLQDLTLGNTLSFDLSFTTDFSGSGAPDRTSLLLLDPATNLTLVDTDLDFASAPVPVQDALLVVDHAHGARIQLPTTSNPSVPGAVPEPGAGGLLWLGLAALTGQRIRRRPCREQAKRSPLAIPSTKRGE